MTLLQEITTCLVVAVAQNGVIGRDGDLPWRMSDDLKWFKSITSGKPIIMGRTTYESLGKPLPGRTNIVLTRQLVSLREGVVVASTLPVALAAGHEAAQKMKTDELCIIGGANLYEQTLPLAGRLYVTTIEANVEGDRQFHLPDPQIGWKVTPVKRIEKGPKNDFPARIERWDRCIPSSTAEA
ncbi:MAG: dihydrofolate reductase [Pseudomonadota bacterium]